MIDFDQDLAVAVERHYTPPLRTKLQISPGVTVLHAAAGFGKTYAMIDACERLRREGISVAWLSCAALSLPVEGVLASIRRFFELFGGAETIFVDELELLSLEQREALLRAFGLASSVRGIVLAVRSLDGLGISRQLADGAVHLVQAETLRWRRRQLSELWQNRLTAKQAGFVDQVAQGWPAISQLLARFLLEGGEPAEETLFPKAELLADYIRAEVLAVFTPAERRLLSMSSLVEDFDDALIRRLESAAALTCDDLVRRLPGVCLYRGDDGRVAYNRTLLLYLRRCFANLSDGVRREALQRAADWASERGDVVLAGNLAARAGDRQRIVDYVMRAGGLRIWVTKGHQGLRAIVRAAGEALVAEEPRLKLLKCAILVKDGRIREAVDLYQEVTEALPTDPETQRGAAFVRLSLVVYGCQLPVMSDSELKLAAQCLDEDPVYREIVPTILAIMHTQQADFAAAAAEISVARAYGQDSGASYNLVFLDCHSATMALARGDLDGARGHLSKARLRWREQFPTDHGIETVILSLGAQLAFEHGNIRQAKELIGQFGHRLAHSEAWLSIYFAGYEPLFRLLAQEQGLSAALAAIERSANQMRNAGLDRIATGLHNLAGCLTGEAILRGKKGFAVSPEGAEPPSGALESWQERELRLLAEAYGSVTDHRPQDALRILDGLLVFAERRELTRTALRALLLRHAVHEMSGNLDAAEADFHAALEIGARTGLRQAFLEFGASAAQARMAAGVPERFAVFTKAIQTLVTGSSSRSKSDLTSRETQILKLLTSGDSDKLIARSLQVTEHAVRFHLKNIYRKLGVHNRWAAIERHRTK